MEPISAAVAAFTALKAGVAAGREIASLGKQIGTLFDAIDQCKSDHSKKKNRQVLSANEEALDTFVARQKADDIEKQLRDVVISTRGWGAWQELLKLRAEIRRERAAEEKRKKLAQAKMIENIIIWGSVALGLTILFGGTILVILGSQGRL
jgi:hypothetical protein